MKPPLRHFPVTSGPASTDNSVSQGCQAARSIACKVGRGVLTAPHVKSTVLLRRSQVGLHCEMNSLSLRSGERVRERGALGIPERFQPMFSRLSPLPVPLPARSSRGEEEEEAPSAPHGFVGYPADSPVRSGLLLFALLVGLLTIPVRLSSAAEGVNELLQKGLFEEEANHNLDAAIKAYQSVITQQDDQRKLAATAVFRLGECYRKLGRTNEATAQYERVLRDFACGA